MLCGTDHRLSALCQLCCYNCTRHKTYTHAHTQTHTYTHTHAHTHTHTHTQIDNGIPIESWYECAADCELLKLLPFLESLASNDVLDVRIPISNRFRMRQLVSGVPAF